jgi:lactate dehydrogenase-like 2-hydroxyacid dehydrogenase
MCSFTIWKAKYIIMIFKKITLIDDCGLTNPILEKLAGYSKEPVTIFNGSPKTDDEILERISGSDCVLVSWQSKINADILQVSTSLKYVGMCCSLYDEKSANVDIEAARKLGIEVKGVRDYGDEGTVEFIFAQLIYLFKGLGKHKWRDEPTELKNKSIGIIGLGTLGYMVAKSAIHFGMQVFYFSRTRKYEFENKNIKFLPLENLLATCDVITTHLPKNTKLLTESEFKIKKANSILVNTSLGPTFEKDALINWLAKDKTSFAIFDAGGTGEFEDELRQLDNVIVSNQYAGFTVEAKQRLSEKVLENLKVYLAKE